MADELVPADASQALALADARHEQRLATFEGGKRKARWHEASIPKKGKRWGLPEDKPFKPLPYVDLPVGLAETEVDQFLREQRLEDLHRKIQLHQLEDVEPDIRPPSPPPLYDRAGNRLNTREVRMRKSMVAEYNRLVRHMIKTVEGYVPPPDWRPQKLVKKIIIPYEKFPQAPFMGVIIGARGVNHKRLQETTGCRIFIRGRDIGDRWQTDEELQMLQHVHIEADNEEQIAAAEKLIMPLLDPESPEFEYARTHGMQQLAVVNGFTLKKQEQRCGVCGAVGHLGFECPETGGQNYKMANVVCSICGDHGHVSSDCKVAAEKRQKEQEDWKAEAERKQNLESEYGRMMSELGISEPNQQPTAAAPAAPAAPAASAAPTPGKAPPAASQALLALPAPQPQPQPRPQPRPRPQPQQAPRRPWASNGAVSQSAVQVAAPRAPAYVVPRIPAPRLPPGSVQLRPAQVPARLPPTPAPRLAGGPPPLGPRASPLQQPVVFVREGGQPARSPFSSPAASPAAPLQLGEADESLLCPPALRPAMQASTLQEVAQETGATVTLTSDLRFRVEGSLEARERAKLHLQAWVDVNLLSSGLAAPGAVAEPPPPPAWLLGDGAPPPLPPGGFPPAGFPPAGFPPAGFPPAGFPPAGFLEGLGGTMPPLPGLSSPGPLGEGIPNGGVPVPLPEAGAIPQPCVWPGLSQDAFEEL